MINPELRWVRVEALTTYQKLSAEIQLRGRLRETISDPEPLMRVRGVETEPLLPGAPRLQGVPEGTLNKSFLTAIWTVEPEPPPPDEVMDMKRRYSLIQSSAFTVKGYAEFPAASDPSLHVEILLKGHFFPLHDVGINFVGVEGLAWQRPIAWFNRDLMVSIFMQ
jgi:hypothetical protein